MLGPSRRPYRHGGALCPAPSFPPRRKDLRQTGVCGIVDIEPLLATEETHQVFGDSSKRSILFWARNEMNYIVFRPIHRRLRGDPRVSISFTGSRNEGRSCAELYERAGAGAVRLASERLSRYRRHDLFVAADSSRPRTRARARVMLYHGVSPKNWFAKPGLRYDRYFVYGNYMRRRVAKSNGWDEEDPRLVMVGFPKVDCLVDGSLDADEIRRELGLDTSRPTVTYAPTHNLYSDSSLSVSGREIIRTLVDMPVNVVVKLHSARLSPSAGGVDWAAALTEWDAPNLSLALGYDSCPYLYVADVLISDVSSVAWEFSLLDRPIIYYHVPGLLAEIRRRGTEVDKDPWGMRAGAVVRDCRGLRAEVERALEDPSERSDVRRAMATDLFHEPGAATERAVAALYDAMGLDAPDGVPLRDGVRR